MDPYISVAALGRALRAKELTAREATDACLERIARLNPQLNAFRVVLADRARADADAAQQRLDAGDASPLLGIPVAIKDNIDIAGEHTQQGTGAATTPATADAELVTRLRRAGAVIVGKTHLPEFAVFPFTESQTYGPSRNPWDPNRTTGGSSGGSAAAVASGMVPIAHATDGGGSIRLPAAMCGLFGLKPTRDLVSLAPDREHWYGLSVANCVARTVEDAALFLAVVAETPDRDYAAAARAEAGPLRIAWTVKPPVPGPVATPMKEAVKDTAALLTTLGHDVTEQAPSWGFGLPAFLPRFLRGIRDDAERMGDASQYEKRIRQLVTLSRPVSDARVERARGRGEALTRKLTAIFDSVDVLLTPTVTHLPEPVGKWTGKSAIRTLNRAANTAAFTTPWNIAGTPAAAVPAGFSAEGLPLSIQLIGPAGAEERLLTLAAQLEAARPWADREPLLSI